MRSAIFALAVVLPSPGAQAASYETSRVVQISGPSPFLACDASGQPALFHVLSPRIDGQYAGTETAGESWEPARGIHVPQANEGDLGHQIAFAADDFLAAFVQAAPTDGASVYLARIARKEQP